MTEKNDAFTREEKDFLREAAQFFGNPSLFARGLNWAGKPLEYAEKKLPVQVRKQIAKASHAAIQEALKISIKTISHRTENRSLLDAGMNTDRLGKLHTGVATLVGGIGGFLGIAALPFELPLSTAIILRSIAEISRQYGADLDSIEARLECMYVFSLGSSSPRDDAIEFIYYSSRVEFAQLLKGASSYIAANSAKDILSAIENGTAPALLTLIARIAARFEIQITDKVLAQAVPVAGAVGGAMFNLFFTNYYNDCAKYHFGVKKIEKIRGIEETQRLFETYMSAKK
jgi:hypothetical protein